MKKLPFVGRKKELTLLNELFQEKHASLASLTGRFRIGKSRLIEEFCKDKKLITLLKEEDLCLLAVLSKQKEKAVVFVDELFELEPFLKILPSLLRKPSKLMIIVASSSPLSLEKAFVGKFDFSLKLHLEELSLAESNHFLEQIGFAGSTEKKLEVLSWTGGIPYYLSLTDFKSSFTEEEFYNIVLKKAGRKAALYQAILTALSKGPLEYLEIASQIDYRSSGALSLCLEELGLFVARDYPWCLKDGKKSERLSKFRLKDNYLLSYLNCKGFFCSKNLQLKNLILNNRSSVFHLLGLKKEEIVREGPYFQHETLKQEACQIDYLIQTRHRTLYACIIRYKEEEIDLSLVKNLQEILKKLILPRGFSCNPVLIHVNGVSAEVIKSQFFFKIIHF